MKTYVIVLDLPEGNEVLAVEVRRQRRADRMAGRFRRDFPQGSVRVVPTDEFTGARAARELARFEKRRREAAAARARLESEAARRAEDERRRAVNAEMMRQLAIESERAARLAAARRPRGRQTVHVHLDDGKDAFVTFDTPESTR